MTEDPHFGFVVAAYLVGFLVVGGMTAAILKDYADLKRALLRFSPSESLPGNPDGLPASQDAYGSGESAP